MNLLHCIECHLFTVHLPYAGEPTEILPRHACPGRKFHELSSIASGSNKAQTLKSYRSRANHTCAVAKLSGNGVL